MAKQGILPAFGTIDSDYRGEVMVNLFNNSFSDVWIQHNQRIAQLVIQPALNVSFVETDVLSDTVRGTAGFGSTGV
jgi:dUTP pyrophosphatase